MCGKGNNRPLNTTQKQVGDLSMLPTNGGEVIRLRYDRLAYSAKTQGAELGVLAQCFGRNRKGGVNAEQKSR